MRVLYGHVNIYTVTKLQFTIALEFLAVYESL